MRFILLLLTLALLFGCTFEKTPLQGETFSIIRGDEQITLSVNLTGNNIPDKVNGKMTVLDKDGKSIYDRDFSVKSNEFVVRGNQTTLVRQLKVENNNQITYANLTLYLPNETFYAEQGKIQTSGTGYIMIEPISHEVQYAINIRFFDGNGKQINPTKGNFSITITDTDSELYYSARNFDERQFSGKTLTILVPYSGVKKSFYNNGSVSVILYANNKQYDRKSDLILNKYNQQEILTEQEKLFSNNMVTLGNITNYVGFTFTVKNAGFYLDYSPNKKELIRFDTVLTNAKPQHQYLIRDDFYMKDDAKQFYAVDAGRSTAFGPLLLKGAVVNATFYFEKRADRKKYYFYYGDKVIGMFEPN
ncbi:MAG: hypothetical protein Q7S22_08815 [Candidatus Micrarchaeota archaeon]|nr:hypothetical protein [Candidatus Micrarchaeota archaeon]